MIQIDHSPRKDAKSQPLLSLMLLHTLELCLSRWVNQLIRSSKVRSYWQKNKENWQKLGSFKSCWVRKPYSIKRSQPRINAVKDVKDRSFKKTSLDIRSLRTVIIVLVQLSQGLGIHTRRKVGSSPNEFLVHRVPFLQVKGINAFNLQVRIPCTSTYNFYTTCLSKQSCMF